MGYLHNDICQFKMITQWDIKRKYNVISTCFFKMGLHYKNFDIYVNGIKRLVSIILKQSKYVLLIFVDQHVIDDPILFNILNISPKIHIVLFKCHKYIRDDFHMDVFGALVRLFPLFNFINNDTLNVIVVDIDLNKDDTEYLILLMNSNQKYTQIIGNGSCEQLLKHKQIPYLFCNLFGVFGIKFDKSIIINFIENAYTINDKGMYGERNTPFGFGTDEIFLNKYLLKCTHDHKLGIMMKYDINRFLYIHRDELIQKMPTQTLSFLNYILTGSKKLPSDDLDLEKLFLEVDKSVYNVDSNDKKKREISGRFYKIINALHKKSKHWFNLRDIQLIHKYFNGIIDCIAVVFFDQINADIIDIKVMQKNK